MVELKKIIALVLFLLGSHILVAQTISVTATLTDSDSQTWNYGTCAINLIPSNYGPSYYGSVLLPTSYACSISSVGVLTATLYNSSTVTPVIAQYKFTICPHASAACTTLSVPITTANQSSILSALLVAPRFTTGSNSYGYLDAEVSPGIIGGQYFNVTTSVSRQCTVITNGACTTWVNAASAGGYTLGGHAVSLVLKCADTSTSSTAYHCATSPTFVPAAGDMVILTAVNQTNSGGATLTVNGQAGTPSITKRQNATGLVAGDLMAGATVLLTFDGIYWEMPGTGATVASTDSPVFTTKITTPLIVGPATHSTGSCSVIGVELSQDGYISWCNGTIWAILVSPSA
jgi:hypothetical protein